MVCTLGPPGSPPALMVLAMRVSLTAPALTGMSTGVGRSVRRKTMPVSGGAGRSVSSTLWPLCTPTPTARVIDLMVRCWIMARIVGHCAGPRRLSRPWPRGFNAAVAPAPRAPSAPAGRPWPACRRQNPCSALDVRYRPSTAKARHAAQLVALRHGARGLHLTLDLGRAVGLDEALPVQALACRPVHHRRLVVEVEAFELGGFEQGIGQAGPFTHRLQREVHASAALPAIARDHRLVEQGHVGTLALRPGLQARVHVAAMRAAVPEELDDDDLAPARNGLGGLDLQVIAASDRTRAGATRQQARHGHEPGTEKGMKKLHGPATPNPILHRHSERPARDVLRHPGPGFTPPFAATVNTRGAPRGTPRPDLHLASCGKGLPTPS